MVMYRCCARVFLSRDFLRACISDGIQVQPSLVSRKRYLLFGQQTSSCVSVTTVKEHEPVSSKVAKMNGVEGYSIRVATDSDMDAVVELLKQFFMTEEPIHSSESKPVHPTELYSLRFLGKGMSFVALSVADGSMAGVCINTEGTPASYAARRHTKETTTDEHMKRTLALLDAAEDEADIWNKYGVDRFFDGRIICVHSSARGKGLGRALLAKSLQMAKERGYKLAHIECTGIYSARIAEQMGMECVCRIPYAEYKDQNGQQIFNIAPPHTELKLFIKKL